MSGPINPHCYSKTARFNSRKSSTDNYETPAWAVESLYNFLVEILGVEFRSVWDPCCARGVILAEIQRLSDALLWASDIREIKLVKGLKATHFQADFLDGHYDLSPTEAMITNPPFSIADEIVLEAIRLDFQIIAILQRTQYMEGDKRFEKLFRNHPETAVAHFIRRVSMEQEGQARIKASGMMTFSWFIWIRDWDQWEGTRLFRIEDIPYFDHDRRLVARYQNRDIEVRHLLNFDIDNQMIYRTGGLCPKCKFPLLTFPKRKRNGTFSCGLCKLDLNVPKSNDKKSRDKFEQQFRVA